jgi:hypothetical protein
LFSCFQFSIVRDSRQGRTEIPLRQETHCISRRRGSPNPKPQTPNPQPGGLRSLVAVLKRNQLNCTASGGIPGFPGLPRGTLGQAQARGAEGPDALQLAIVLVRFATSWSGPSLAGSSGPLTSVPVLARVIFGTAVPKCARFDEVRYAALSISDSRVSILQDFVPYRFLTPWLRTALMGVNDHARNPLIQFLASRSARSPFPTPYRFD